MFVGKAVRNGVPQGKQPQRLAGANQRTAKPGAHLAAAPESAPFLFLLSVRDDETTLTQQDSLYDREVGGIEGQWILPRLLRGVRPRRFPRHKQPGIRFKEQDL